jgi:hypothetical protein
LDDFLPETQPPKERNSKGWSGFSRLFLKRDFFKEKIHEAAGVLDTNTFDVKAGISKISRGQEVFCFILSV